MGKESAPWSNARHVCPLPRVRVLLPPHNFTVPKVPDVRHLGVERLPRGFRCSAVTSLDDDRVAAPESPLDLDTKAVEVLRNPHKDAFEHHLWSDKRPAGPPCAVLGLIPLHLVVENPEQSRNITLRYGLIGPRTSPTLSAMPPFQNKSPSVHNRILPLVLYAMQRRSSTIGGGANGQ